MRDIMSGMAEGSSDMGNLLTLYVANKIARGLF